MPDFIDNCAGVTSVTGTADYLIDPIGTGRHLRPDQVLANGQQVAYYAVYESTGTSGFESGLASWSKSLNTLEVLSVTGSSNGNAKVSWGEGNKIIHIVANSDMLDVPVLGIDELDVGDDPDGTEIAHFLQDGDGVSLTAQQVSGDPMLQQKSLANNRSRDFTQFEGLLLGSATDGAFVGAEKFIFYKTGAGEAENKAGTYFTPCLQLGVTNTNDVAIVQHSSWPLAFFAGTNDYDNRWAIIIPILTTDAHDFELEIGFTTSISGATVPCAQGIFFATIDNNPNWQLRVRNLSGTTTVDTGIAVTTAATVLRVKYDAALVKSRYWLNGTELTSILDSTRAVGFLATLGMTASIRKINGVGVERNVVLFAHKYDNKKDALPNFT